MTDRKSQRGVNRRLMRLRSQHKYYISALKDMKFLLVEYEIEWLRDYSKILSFIPKESKDDNIENKKDTANYSKIEIPISKDVKEEIESKDFFENSPAWAKSLYRKIVKETHPDKIKDEDRKDKMKSIFQNAARSIESREYNNLIDIAIDLGINIEIPPIAMIKKLTSRIKSMRKEILEIERSLPWVWGESFGILDVRLNLLESVLRAKNVEYADREKIIEIISTIESDLES